VDPWVHALCGKSDAGPQGPAENEPRRGVSPPWPEGVARHCPRSLETRAPEVGDMWGKLPVRGDTAPGMSRGRAANNHVSPPKGGSV